MNENPPEHILVFIPGFMGSQLRSKSTGELVWLDFPALVSDPIRLQENMQAIFEQLKYPNEDLVADNISDQIIFLPPLLKQDEYGSFLRTLSSWGYIFPGLNAKPGQKPAYTFPYDWRQDNRISARQLAEAIERWASQHPGAEVWIIAHSLGGMVARWYIEKEGGKDIVKRLFLIGSPWDGTPKSLKTLMNGVDWFLLRALNRFGLHKMVHEAALTFPCFYQLLPLHRPFLKDETGKELDLFSDPMVCGMGLHQPFLFDAVDFGRDLGTSLSIETYCFFGISRPTPSQGVVRYSQNGQKMEITWQENEEGDGTITVHSGLHHRAKERLPYSAGHGDLYTHRPLLDKLHFELVSRYRYGMESEPVIGKYHARFLTDQQAYSPGETIQLLVCLSNSASKLPVQNAQVEAALLYRNAVLAINPASIPVIDGESMPSVQLEPVAERPGEYSGHILAPEQEGYYSLQVRFKLPEDPPLELHDLILIDRQD